MLTPLGDSSRRKRARGRRRGESLGAWEWRPISYADERWRMEREDVQRGGQQHGEQRAWWWVGGVVVDGVMDGLMRLMTVGWRVRGNRSRSWIQGKEVMEGDHYRPVSGSLQLVITYYYYYYNYYYNHTTTHPSCSHCSLAAPPLQSSSLLLLQPAAHSQCLP